MGKRKYNLDKENEIKALNRTIQKLQIENKELAAKLNLNSEFSSFPELNPNPVFEIDSHKKITYCNKGARKILRKIKVNDDMRHYFPEDLNDIIKALKNKKITYFEREVTIGNYIFSESICAIPKLKRIRFFCSDITTQKNSESNLLNTKQLLEKITQTSPVIVTLYDIKKEKIIYQSNTLLLSLGYSPGEISKVRKIMNRNRTKAIHPEDMKILEEDYNNIDKMEDGKNYSIEYRMRGKNGEWQWIRKLSTIFQRDEKGRPEQLVSIFENVDYRRKAEEALRVSEERYRLLAETSQEAIVVHLDGKIIFANNAAAKLVGAALPDELAHKKALDFVHPDCIESVKERIRTVLLKNKTAPVTEEKFIRMDGRVIDVEVSAFPFNYKGVTAVQTLIRDISERKIAEEALKESQRTFSTLLSNMPGIAYRCQNDRFWTMGYISKGCLRLTGYDSSDLIGNNKISYADLIVPEDRERIWNEVQDALSKKQPFQLEYRIRTASGKTKWVWERGVGNYSSEGELQPLEGFISDITERKNAEEALRESEARYKAVIESAGEAIISCDCSGRIIAWNKAAEKMFGYKGKEIVGKTMSTLIPEHIRDMISINYNNIPSNIPDILEGRIIEGWGLRKNGTEFPLELSVTEWQTKNVKFYSAIIRDISERLKSIQALRESEERYRLLFESNPFPMWAYDIESNKFIAVNEAAVRHYGYSREEFLSMKVPDIEVLEDGNRLVQYPNMENTVEAGVRTHRIKDGSLIKVKITTHPLYFASIKAIMVLAADVTESKRIEDALKASEEMNRAINENSPIGITVRSRTGRLLNYNNSWKRIYSLSNEHIVNDATQERGEPAFDDTYSYTDSSVIDIKRVFKEGGTLYIPETHIHNFKPGGAEWVSNYFYAVMNEKNEVDRVIILTQDITERKRASEQLNILYEASKKLNKSLDIDEVYSTVHEFIARSMDCDGLFISSYNQNTLTIHCESAWVEGRKKDVSKFPPIPLEKEGRGTQSVSIRTGKSLIMNDYESKRKSAEHSYFIDRSGNIHENIPENAPTSRSALIVPLKSESRVMGTIQVFSYKKNAYSEEQLKLLESLSLHISSAIRNAVLFKKAQEEIKERKEAEDQLRKISRAVEQSPACVIITDTKGTIEYVNPKFTQITGYTLQEVIGKNPRILKSGEMSELEYKHLWKTISSGGEWHGEFHNKKKNGELYWESALISPVKDSKGKTTHFLAVKEDITEKKLNNEKLRRTLREKEVMLREIHHRVKNNLQIISSLLRLQSNFISDPLALEYFNISQNRVKSMALIHQLLYKSSDLGSINFGDYMKQLVTQLFHSYRIKEDRIKLTVEANNIFFGIDTAIPCGLLINELLSNALKHAFPGKQEGEIEIRLLSEDENRYTLVFSDNGVGFPEDLDFSQTKSLGMQLVITLTEQLNGTIRMERSNGTKFYISFSSTDLEK